MKLRIVKFDLTPEDDRLLTIFAFLLIPMVYYAVTVQARFRHTMEPLITIFTVFLFRSAERRRSKVAAQPDLAEQTTQA